MCVEFMGGGELGGQRSAVWGACGPPNNQLSLPTSHLKHEGAGPVQALGAGGGGGRRAARRTSKRAAARASATRRPLRGCKSTLLPAPPPGEGDS